MSNFVIILQTTLCLMCSALIWSWLKRSESTRIVRTLPYDKSPWPPFDRWRNVTKGKDILHRIYQTQVRDNQPRALCGIFGDSVVVPPSMLPWLLLQSEDDLSAKWAQMDALNIPMTFLKADIGINPVHEPLVRRNLTAHLDDIAGLLHQEVAIALDDLWGKDTESWHEVNLDYTIRRVVARASNRIFVGDDLCRDNDYIENSISYVTWVSACGLLINLLPRWLRGTLGVAFTVPIRVAYSRCSKHLLPLITALLDGQASASPHLFSSWLVDNLAKLPSNSPEHTPDYLSRRIMALNFAAIHTSTLTAANLILDIFSAQQSAPSPLAAAEAVVGALRDEARASRARWGGDATWRRARLNEMSRLDSALRESMRRWGLVPKALSRRVMRPQGVALPSGQHLPQGTTVCVSGWGLHHDEEVYARPFEFVYDRFVGGSSSPPSSGADDAKAKAKAASTAEIDRQFAAWGIGKHACPGRFFAVDLIKIIVTRVLLDYEVKIGEMRPENTWIKYNVTPPPTATVSLRRREGTV